jgi:hypothetical protein
VRVPSDAAQLLPYVTPEQAGKQTVIEGTHVPAGFARMMKKQLVVRGGHYRTGDVDGERVPVKVICELRKSRARVGQVEIETAGLEQWKARSPEGRGWWVALQQPLLDGMEPRGVHGELRVLALHVLVMVLGARRIMWVMALMAIIEERGTIELLPNGKLPDWVRLELMEMTGCPARKASKAQADTYRDFLDIVMYMHFHVVPTARGGKRRRATVQEKLVPLLAISAVGRDGYTRVVQVNRLLADHWMRIPRALMQVTDADDPEGVMRALGLAIVTRLELAAARGEAMPSERLQLMLERAGMLQWCEGIEHDRRQGRAEVKRRIEEALQALRSVPVRGRKLPSDVVGRVTITWGAGKRWLSGAKLTVESSPPWHRLLHRRLSADTQAPPALPAAAPPALPTAGS